MKRLVILFLIVVGVNGLVRAQQNKVPTPSEIAQKM
jgi:protein CpxP